MMNGSPYENIVSNGKGRSLRRPFLGRLLLLKQSFPCKYPGIRWCSRRSVCQDRKNYG